MNRINPTEKERAKAKEILPMLSGLTFEEASMVIAIVSGLVGAVKRDLIENSIFQAKDAETV